MATEEGVGKGLIMRIAIISCMKGNPWGGSEELWLALAKEALREGIEVAALTYLWPSPSPKILDLKERGALVLHQPLPGSNHSMPQKMYRKIVGRSNSTIRELFHSNPDVVCISQPATYDAVYLNELISLLYNSSVPYIVLCHNINETQLPPQSVREATTEFFKRAYRVVFTDHRTFRIAERHLARTISNVIFLRNPVNLSDKSIVPWPSTKKLSMASVGHLEVYRKGQDILLETLASEVWRDRDWRLQFFGEGRDKSYLEALSLHYGISERVSFAGHVNDVRTIWSGNHLLVFPSRLESAPLSMVEAMLCGRPCVATDIGGVMEWLEEGKTGFIAEAPTVRSFGAALERAWLARDDWEKIGTRAREGALSRVDPNPGKSLLQVMLNSLDST